MDNKFVYLLIGLVLATATGLRPTLAHAEFKNLAEDCVNDLKKFPGATDEKLLRQACSKVKADDICVSVDGRPIYRYDKEAIAPTALSKSKDPIKRVLVFSLIHGDETPAGAVGRYWMERLESIEPRNTWRVIPILNPDGVKNKTRTNANNIDLNRNFPTRDWNELAQSYWKSKTLSNPRRFPGKESASEPETKCALKQIEDFKPDFIVSVHTPLKVLDFDGPRISPPPKFDYLPWKSLGHFPGSLGRYMWFERQTPVLTMELKENLPASLGPLEKLQDIIGTLVKIEAHINNKESDQKKTAEIKTSFYTEDH